MQHPPNTIMPGMSQVIEAGETLEITDADGKKFAVEAKEAANTMAFLKAFDEWYILSQKAKTSPVSKQILDALWNQVEQTYRNLEQRVKRELPSFKNAGVIAAGHRH